MMKLFFLVSFFNYVSYVKNYYGLIGYIKKDLLERNIFLNEAISFEVKSSVYIIPFRITSVSESLLRKEYIADFSYRNTDLVRLNQKIITRVEDSMEILNRVINNKCKIPAENNAPEINRTDTCVTFFFAIVSGLNICNCDIQFCYPYLR